MGELPDTRKKTICNFNEICRESACNFEQYPVKYGNKEPSGITGREIRRPDRKSVV